MKVVIKKLYKGRADVRDYIALQCIKENKPLTIYYEDEKMTILPEDLKRKRVDILPVRGLVTGRNYNLWSYEWEQDN